MQSAIKAFEQRLTRRLCTVGVGMALAVRIVDEDTDASAARSRAVLLSEPYGPGITS
jgi:hypothetical protein